MNNYTNNQQVRTNEFSVSNSTAIRQEIQRFESVHPSIYAVYELINLLPTADARIVQQIHEHVVCIEDSFVHSQEWTLARSVPDLRLGIVGSLNSGKSALVHRYLTGTYMQEESPEGGRFKKEVFIDGKSYLLLIRDEGGAPEMQFVGWVDAVIFVFSLENENSFNTVYNYYTKMAHLRNGKEIPVILVGTQDAISDRSPRIIDDTRARKLANELKRCSYYETCATYGLNVERVFHDACQKILQTRPTTPQGSQSNRLSVTSFHHSENNTPTSPTTPPAQPDNVNGYATPTATAASTSASTNNLTLPGRHHVLSTSSHHIPMRISTSEFLNAEQKLWTMQSGGNVQQQQQRSDYNINENNNITKYNPTIAQSQTSLLSVSNTSAAAAAAAGGSAGTFNLTANDHQTSLSMVQLRDPRDIALPPGKELPTPTSTPTTARKSRRRSNLFIPSSSKKVDKEQQKNGELGSGRSIPIKQGYLYKRSSKSLNKEWKKKYVTLCDDGRLTYHPSLHDYMEDVHGKEIPLQYVTVKVPGQKPRGSKSIITNSALTTSLHVNAGKIQHQHQQQQQQQNQQQQISEGVGCLALNQSKDKRGGFYDKLTLYTNSELVKSNSSQQTSGDEGIAMSNSNSQTFIASDNQLQQQQQQREMLSVSVVSSKQDAQTPNVKKRHRRIKSSSVKANETNDDVDAYEFYIVSLDSKQWHFEAANSEERDDWVTAIEHEIFKSLQSIESTKLKPATTLELASMITIRTRNGYCADCNQPNPEWASLNLGVALCIECSGIHRNLGSHISKVRSLGLDDWPASHLSVMLAIGNSLANSIWEANKRQRQKPLPHSTREDKELWIRSKYESKEFLTKCNTNSLIEAVVRADMKSIITILATCNKDVTNMTVNPRDVRTPLLLACAIGNLAIAQLLIWYGANIKHTDNEGRTCLAYARAAQSLAKAKSLKAAAQSSSSASNTSSTSSTGAGAGAGAAVNSKNGSIPTPQYNVEDTTALVELLVGLGCPESAPMTASGTLPRRRDTLGTPYEKTVSGVI